jgi:peptidoglycan hydrolase-like protein with peptidoglycan-binding domain
VQTRLMELGFWSTAADGEYGFTTKQAVMAFQKYIGLPADGSVDKDTAAYLVNFGEKAHASANTGTLVEVDKAKQLLFVVVDGKTQWTFNTSTGSGIPYEAKNKKDPTKIEKGDAITPDGLFKTTRERPEGWWEGDLGKIYRPKYFNGGIAVHGMTSVPNHPASHGCVRLSTGAMDFIWDSNLVPLHTTVWVHS